ncbi:MAG: hypothetical protein ACK457_11870 [Flavobacteriia bacterium]|jgi:hypothetical protein
MKKILILAYDFPPYVSVGGLRPYNWFKYLREFGIEPIVITRQWDNKYGNHLDYVAPGVSVEQIIEKVENGTIIRTPYNPNLSNRILLKYGENRFRLLRKIISGYYEFAQFIFPIGPKSEIFIAAQNYLRENKVDAIIASGDPFILFSYASQLSDWYGIPWIADYRDPWSQNFSTKKGVIQRKWDLLFEQKTVRSASKIITVDELFKLKIGQLFPDKEILILPNGFDPNLMIEANKIEQKSKILSFSFVGTIYKWHPVKSLMKGFQKFKEENPTKPFELKLYGINNSEEIKNLLEEEFHGLIENVQIIRKLPNDDLLKELSKNNVLILFNYYQFTGTKIYDYLGLKRKIILCFTKDDEALILKDSFYFKTLETDIQPQIEILKETNSGIIVKDSEHLMEVLNDLWKEFESTGKIACHSVGVENYSRKIQVEKLAEIVKSL